MLDILGEQREKVVVGLSSAGQVREFQLRIRLRFRLRTPQGKELIGDTELLQQRDISYNETVALAKEAEENLLYADMQSDLVQQLQRRWQRPKHNNPDKARYRDRMKIDQLPLASTGPGHSLQLPVFRFGTPGASPKAYIQGALHADEVPAILVAQQLCSRLQVLEQQGLVLGEVVLVPCANPLGFSQHVLGQLQGRFDLADGANFNRGFAGLADSAAIALQGQLGPDEAANNRLVRLALAASARALTADTPATHLKNTLLQLAIDADVVLDLHCDSQALMHVYALSPQAALATELGALLGARAVLLATESGDSPFDEACSSPWLTLQQRFAAHPIGLACFSATVELRGEADTHHALAAQDADALLAFLQRRGLLGGPATPLPTATCQPTPLAGSEPLVAPHPGVVVFRRELGEQVSAGDCIVDVVNAETGAVTALCCQSDGVLYARCSTRWAYAGKRLARIAGTSLTRTGKLLGP